MSIRLMFVDGPVGSGKEYFIESFIGSLKSNRPELSIVTWDASDFVMKATPLMTKCKCVKDTTDSERVNEIYEGHKELISQAAKLFSSSENQVDLLIVKRSILTTLSVNLWEDTKQEQREFMATDFSRYVKLTLEEFNIESLFVRIDVDVPGVTRGVNILLSRLAECMTEIEVDVEWLYTILNTYRRDHELAAKSFTYNDAFSSSESDMVVKRYFKSLTSEVY